jgi:hypothetical protein
LGRERRRGQRIWGLEHTFNTGRCGRLGEGLERTERRKEMGWIGGVVLRAQKIVWPLRKCQGSGSGSGSRSLLERWAIRYVYVRSLRFSLGPRLIGGLPSIFSASVSLSLSLSPQFRYMPSNRGGRLWKGSESMDERRSGQKGRTLEQ